MSADASKETVEGDSAESSAIIILSSKIPSRKKNIHDHHKERNSMQKTLQ